MQTFTTGNINQNSSCSINLSIANTSTSIMCFVCAYYSTGNVSGAVVMAQYYIGFVNVFGTTNPAISITCGSSYGGTNGILTITANRGIMNGYYITT
jgi:hypothetical protein